MGIALARRLAVDGLHVTVLESDDQPGGLATWHDFGDFYWDRFYHVMLPTDRHLIRFISEIGLDDSLEWRRTYTGFFVNRTMYSISTNLEFLKFPLLSMLSKIRLAWTMLYCSRINDWRRLETVPVEDFLLRTSGSEAYNRLWRPLLLAKLGQRAHNEMVTHRYRSTQHCSERNWRSSTAGSGGQLRHVSWDASTTPHHLDGWC
jgi:protoporphyrinogen oxidase